jgi:uncharacterized membrane protein YheB (UPF0754 family)
MEQRGAAAAEAKARLRQRVGELINGDLIPDDIDDIVAKLNLDSSLAKVATRVISGLIERMHAQQEKEAQQNKRAQYKKDWEYVKKEQDKLIKEIKSKIQDLIRRKVSMEFKNEVVKTLVADHNGEMDYLRDHMHSLCERGIGKPSWLHNMVQCQLFRGEKNCLLTNIWIKVFR